MATAKDPVKLDENQRALVVQALETQRSVYLRAARAEKDREIADLKNRQAQRCDAVITLVRDGALF